MGLCFITEGVLPFAKRSMPLFLAQYCISAITGGLAMAAGVETLLLTVLSSYVDYQQNPLM